MAEKELRSVVLSYRVTASVAENLAEELDENPHWGIKTPRQFARKILEDYLDGKLEYVQETSANGH